MTGHFQIVFLYHHIMRVAVKADVLEPDVRVCYAGSRKILRCAVIVNGVIGRFGGHDQDGNAFEIGELARRVTLRPLR